ncbi:uncharacterized protein [Lepeophtheirus salmonis]|uniref:uncharacterized protein n=1 Tax=Lepeophtheirus salmonis TaxID=72036 RepID=UPI003AF3423E
MKNIDHKFINIKENMKQTFSNIYCFCLTADCWSPTKRGYIGQLSKDKIQKKSNLSFFLRSFKNLCQKSKIFLITLPSSAVVERVF